MRIVVLSASDPTSPSTWSGTTWHVIDALRRAGHSVSPVGPLAAPFRRLRPTVERAVKAVGARPLHTDRWPAVVQRQARGASRLVASKRPDLVVAMGAPVVAYLDIGAPTVIWTDATLRSMLGFYPEFTGWSRLAEAKGDRVERRALARASGFVGSSSWATASARGYYGLPLERLATVQFGANLFGAVPAMSHLWERERAVRLLAIGVDWFRKGFDVAVGATLALRERGLPAELDIVGCLPPRNFPLPAGIRMHGFISKTTSEGRAALEELYSRSRFLLLPARAECAAVVVAEAAARGLPTIGSDVGGMSSLVRAAVSGVLLPCASNATQYADELASLLRDDRAYGAMRSEARKQYEDVLNWDVSCERLLAWARGVS